MAGAGVYSDFTILNPEYHSGQLEFLARNLAIFNSASRNAITLTSQAIPGLYEKSTFFPNVSGLIQRRDPSVITAVDDLNFTQDDHYKIKLNRRLGPVAHTLDSWRKIGDTPEKMSFIFGRMAGEAKVEDNVDLILTALCAAIEGVSSASGTYDLVHDARDEGTTDTGKMCAEFLSDAISLMGDGYARISAFVMHSKPFFDLIKNQITENIFGITNMVIHGGSPATLGRPVIVMDSDSLVDDAASGVSAYSKVYKTLCLVSGAASVVETERETVVSDMVTGLENLVGRVQGEYAVNIGMRGISYNYSTGGANPTLAAIGSTANWEQVATSIKDCPGVVLKTR